MLKPIFYISIIVWVTSCNNRNEYEFIHISYDTNVINNISHYDLIRKIVTSNIEDFDFTNRTSFTYVYNFDSLSTISGFSNDSLPVSIITPVKCIFKQLGKDYIFGFTISKDSCFEILLRNSYLKSERLDVRERLYWKQCAEICKKTAGIQDTLLSNEWQYCIWLDKRSDFF